jgi:hypothetical protein
MSTLTFGAPSSTVIAGTPKLIISVSTVPGSPYITEREDSEEVKVRD